MRASKIKSENPTTATEKTNNPTGFICNEEKISPLKIKEIAREIPQPAQAYPMANLNTQGGDCPA